MKCFYNLKPFTNDDWGFLKRRCLTSYYTDSSIDHTPVPYTEEDEWVYGDGYKANLFKPDILEITFEDGTEYIISKDGKFWVEGSVNGVVKWRGIKAFLEYRKYPDCLRISCLNSIA